MMDSSFELNSRRRLYNMSTPFPFISFVEHLTHSDLGPDGSVSDGSSCGSLLEESSENKPSLPSFFSRVL